MEKRGVRSILQMGRQRFAVSAGVGLPRGQRSGQGSSERSGLQRGAFGFPVTCSGSSFCSEGTCTFGFMCITICPNSFLWPRKMISSLKCLVRGSVAPRGRGQPQWQRGDPVKPSRISAFLLSVCYPYFIPTAGTSVLS